MTADDVDDVMVIDRLAFSAPWKASGYRYEVEENSRAHYRVLTAVGQLIGFTGHWLMVDEAHISTIAVHPDWRGMGLGELLLLSTLFRAGEQAAAMVTLEVRRSNTAAQTLYRKYRFEQVGMRKRYYRDNREDALIMTIKPLDGRYQAFIEQRWTTVTERLAAVRLPEPNRVSETAAGGEWRLPRHPPPATRHTE